MSETKFVTILFEFDIRSMRENPFHTDTPFGRPVTIAVGDVFQENEDLEERVQELEAIVQP